MKLANPVVVVPGITASSLRDEYPVAADVVWSTVLHKSYERVMLHPDDVRYELREPARVREDEVFSVPYRELILELRHNLSQSADEPVPVFPFAYDWRQPLDATEARLATFVQEVIARTKLLKHYDRSAWKDAPRVDLVGHSMGGLVVAGYLATQDGAAPVERVVTLASPFQGSYEAILKVLTGTASLSSLESNSREREAARLTPALYHLLPSFARAVIDDTTGEEVDVYAVDAWQEGVLQTLAEFIRLYGVQAERSQRARMEQARALLSSLLDAARAHRRRIDALRLPAGDVTEADWLAIVGVDTKTRVQLRLGREGGKPRYELSSNDRKNTWGQPGDPSATGDGTVPFLGAEPKFLRREQLVCLSPDDLGYWEFGDRGLEMLSGWHGILPKCNVVHRLITKHFLHQDGDGSVWGRPAPGVSADHWEPPIAKLRAK